jgi:carbon storage regulator
MGGKLRSSFHANQGSVFMLVLTRKYQEKIRIGDNITITVLRTKGKAVRLGIEAPNDVPVVRGELSFATDDDTEQVVPKTLTPDSNGVKRPATGLTDAARWETDSPRRLNARRRDSQREHVQLKRMSRSEAADYLPKLISSGAPLRAMMEQR